MIYYIYKDKLLLSKDNYKLYKNSFKEVSEEEAKKYKGKIFALNSLNPEFARRSYIITNESNLFIEKEGIDLLKKSEIVQSEVPNWIKDRISDGRIISLNTDYPNWEEALDLEAPKKWRINVIGLGDVGGTLLSGLKLLGHEDIISLGLYDRDINRINRWKFELSQLLSPDMKENTIEIVRLKEDNLFDCDMFVFCVSMGVPEVGKEGEDVRLVQFKGNAKIIAQYAKMARHRNFKGIFAVVSDPVDLLCKVAHAESNKDDEGNFDLKGLLPEQIRGYGLGVMNARACYYAEQNAKTNHYKSEGRAFGPHGEGLIIADSIKNYNSELSEELTEKTKTANLEVRSTGFKPYIAPALSSGSLALLATIKSQWHYSATFLGGTFMGSRNKLKYNCTELESLELPENLFEKLEQTYTLLDKLYNQKS
jgi:malate/lactate dehydrogenase